MNLNQFWNYMIILQFLNPSIPTVLCIICCIKFTINEVLYISFSQKGWTYNEWMVSSLMESTTKITTVARPEGGHATINRKALILACRGGGWEDLEGLDFFVGPRLIFFSKLKRWMIFQKQKDQNQVFLINQHLWLTLTSNIMTFVYYNPKI